MSDPDHPDRPGYEPPRKLNKVGLHAQDTAELFFNDVAVPVANRMMYSPMSVAARPLPVATNRVVPSDEIPAGAQMPDSVPGVANDV